MQAKGGVSLNMISSSKKQKYLRVSIHNPTKTAGATIVYNSKTVRTLEESANESSIRTLSGEDAAGNLFDLIGLNPDYHFKINGGFNFKTPVFEGYRVELINEDQPIKETNRYRPSKLLLYKIDETTESLIRSIEYLSFFENIEPYIQPKEIKFTDESTGETGSISIQKFEYNVGLPNFLFELGEDTVIVEE